MRAADLHRSDGGGWDPMIAYRLFGEQLGDWMLSIATPIYLWQFRCQGLGSFLYFEDRDG